MRDNSIIIGNAVKHHQIVRQIYVRDIPPPQNREETSSDLQGCVGVEPPGTEAQTRMTSEMGVGSQIRDTQR